MKHRRTIVIVLLNVLFCAYMLWFTTNNSFLRPFAGSKTREFLAGLILLITLYANYFLLYPKLHKKHPVVYWVVLVSLCIIAAAVDFAIAHRFMIYCNSAIIEEIGAFRFFSEHYKLIVIRNVTLNAFPFIFRERQELRKALDAEVQVVYRDTQMVDVIDHESNLLMIPKDDIYYCVQDGNFTRIYTVDDRWFTRLGSMKHLVQLFGEEDFVRISPTVLIPYQYIWSCNGSEVFLKKMPWTKKPLTFTLDPKNSGLIAEQVAEGLQRCKAETAGEQAPKRKPRSKSKRKPVVPPQQKLDMVQSCVQANPGCNTTDIVAQTEISLSTVERCLSELRKRKLVKYVGSKRHGGYHAMPATNDGSATSAPSRRSVTDKKVSN